MFAGVHIFVEGGDVPDDQAARLVVLPPAASHKQGRVDSEALQVAHDILDRRGSAPRLGKNMLIFVAADADRVGPVEQAVRQFLAWGWIRENEEQLNLDSYGRRQADENKKRWNETVQVRLQETYAWLLVPYQEGAGPWMWNATRISGGDTIVKRAERKLKTDEQLIGTWSPALLKMELDRWLWKDAEHYETKKLRDALANYGYLPRLANERVLLDAIAAGLRSQDFFGYAASVSPTGRYEGLVFGEGAPAGAVTIDSASVLVKPSAAVRQLEDDDRKRRADEERRRGEVGTGDSRPGGNGHHIGEDGPDVGDDQTGNGPGVIDMPPPPDRPTPPPVLSRFYGSVAIDPQRAVRDATTIVEEIVQHLTALAGANVRLTIEIGADMPDGAPNHIVRTVTENARTLKFRESGFEET